MGHLPAAGIVTDPEVTGPCDAGCCDGVTLFRDTRDDGAAYCTTHAKIVAMARLFT